MASTERILLFIPAYNCEKQIPRVIAQLTPEVRERLTECIVVDNRSTDGTQAAAIRALEPLAGKLRGCVLMNDENYNLGGSHKVAFNYALDNGFDYLIVLHGDDQGSIRDLMPHIAAGKHRDLDCLLGARFMPGSRLTGYSAVRTLGNVVFNLMYSAVARQLIFDLGSGLNMYAVRRLADRSYLRFANNLTFNYHMILNSIANKQRFEFFPLEWREEDQISNMKGLRHSLVMVTIIKDYALDRRRFLEQDHSGRSGAYTSTVVFDNARIAEHATS